MTIDISKNYKIEIGEVLEGSALLKKQDSNTDRVKFYIENIKFNKAYSDYFSKKHFYDSHTPIISNRKNFDQKPSGAYMSYDLNTQLNCKPLLELCLNEKIIKSAQKYLECPPILFSINTFKTLPNQKAFTHSFHRDLDDFLCHHVLK